MVAVVEIPQQLVLALRVVLAVAVVLEIQVALVALRLQAQRKETTVVLVFLLPKPAVVAVQVVLGKTVQQFHQALVRVGQAFPVPSQVAQ